MKTSISEKDSLKNQEEKSSLTISLIPNPASSTIKIVVDGSGDEFFIQVYNMMGQIVSSGVINENESFDVSNFKQGMYVLKFTSTLTGARYNSRLVILR